MRIIYKSVEDIEARCPLSKEWIRYRGVLQVSDSGTSPVKLDLKFEPPHPFHRNMPESHSLKGKSVTEVYVKLTKFLRRNGFEFG
jgi:hypothetical protein